MAMDVDVPEMGESVTEVVLLEWLKRDGDWVERDEPICVLETDKANVDLPAPAAGFLHPVAAVEQTLAVGALVARIGDVASASASRPAEGSTAPAAAESPVAAPAPAAATVQPPPTAPPPVPSAEAAAADREGLSPAVRRLVEEHRVDPAAIQGTGRGGRLIKQDVMAYIKEREREAREAATPPAVPPAAAPAVVGPEAAPGALPAMAPAPAAPPLAPLPGPVAEPERPAGDGTRREPISRIRRRIAERLVAAQRTAAMLTTFNEADLSQVTELRRRHKEAFQERHGVSLGLMSFFSRACILALREFPEVNASIEGDEVVYHDYVNLGIAVSSERGLMVPVLRQAQALSMARIESEIKRLATAARENKLTLDDLSGGTFTITNGGVFGSLLSTPILTPPQTGILGMHAIKDRPVAAGGQVVVRPMMYLALTYDHRLIDGRTSVTFLVRIKELLEDPTRLLLEV